jgi:hypothetical protein
MPSAGAAVLWLRVVTALLYCRIVKLVRAIRKGWIKTGKAKRAEQQQPQVYLLWGDDDQVIESCLAVQRFMV